MVLIRDDRLLGMLWDGSGAPHRVVGAVIAETKALGSPCLNRTGRAELWKYPDYILSA